MRLIDADKLKEVFDQDDWGQYLDSDVRRIIDNAPTVKQQKVVTIPHELIEKLVLCVVDTVENIDWDKALEVYKERPHGKWIEQTDYNGDTYYDCSTCGNSWCTIEGTPWNNGMNYCPNCGAKMDGGEEYAIDRR